MVSETIDGNDKLEEHATTLKNTPLTSGNQSSCAHTRRVTDVGGHDALAFRTLYLKRVCESLLAFHCGQAN